MLIDAHAHLEAPQFAADLPQVLQRARAAGVERIVTVGATPQDWQRAHRIVQEHPFLYGALGLHPHVASEEVDLERLRDLLAGERMVAVGEVGLDFYRDLSPRDVQRRRFGQMLELAEELGLPVVVHVRQAHAEALEVLRAHRVRGMVHCFGGSYREAASYLDLGLYLSISGTVTYPRADALREVVGRLPLDRLLVETDAPYLAPVPHRGRRNEPALLVHTVREVARAMGTDPERVAQATWENARRLFGLP